ncbi:tRNA lysidine(34) synthetase TilS [Ectothiorhodospiraceae bacterium WFHF3C12]|nr:tRNA lysidine(34) synthetase TilS [Ectothiorhodospiraceae bacterium WFHF3C12]
MTRLDPQYLADRLGHRAGRPVWVAYSGGRDSHVLLHLAVHARLDVRAVHVDHGLHPDSGDWADHCEAVCRSLGVALTRKSVNVDAEGPSGPEAAARAARYRAFREILEPEAVMLTAHHRDDQAETVMLRILRGAGLRGLAGIPRERQLGRGWMLRPLLDVPRAEIDAYAREHALIWFDDPSNESPDPDRNYLRQFVMPAFESRWPAAAQMLGRLAGQAREDARLLDELADLDLKTCADADSVSVSALKRLDRARQRNVLRRWLRLRDRRPPSAARLEAGLDALLSAAADREPVLRWEEGLIRRYRDRLYLLGSRTTVPPEAVYAWDMAGVLVIPGIGRLSISETHEGERLSAVLLDREDITVRLRRGGERIRLPGSAHHRPLKTLFQEAGVPPWERRRTPLVYAGDALACVGERWISADFAATGDEPGLRIRWLPEH